MDSESPQPLEYRAPRDDRPPNPQKPWMLFFLGLLAGGAIAVITGFVSFTTLYPDFLYWSAPLPPLWLARLPVIVFITAAAGTAVGAYERYRLRRQPHFALGMLMSLCVVCSIEGLCFANP